MSNIVEPQITETKPSKFGDFIKNNPNILQNIIGNTSSTPVLCKDGSTKNQLSSPTGKYADACINNGGRAVNQPIQVKSTTNEVKKQNLLVGDGDVLTFEDKFYEKLGIKYHNTHMFGVASRLKGRLLLAVILIGTYFAYKKIK